jgi:hypothetical protein
LAVQRERPLPPSFIKDEEGERRRRPRRNQVMTSELASGCGPLSRTEYACLLDGRPHGVGRVALGLVASLLAGPFRLLCTGCYVKRLPFALLFTRKRGALRGALPTLAECINKLNLVRFKVDT